MRHTFVLVCLSIIAAAPVVADTTAVVDGTVTAGVAVTADVDAVNPSLVHFTTRWLAPSDRARVSVIGPAVVVSSSIAADTDGPQGWMSKLVPVAAGDHTDVVLEVIAEDEPVVVLAERAQGDLTFQAVASVTRSGGRTRISSPSMIQVRHERLPSGGGVITAESIGPKLAIAAEVFADDNTDYPIPDGPTDCSTGSTVWPLTTVLSVNSAPSSATVSAVTVHVNVTHPDMSDLQIVFAKEFYTVAKYLWRNGAGTNLNRDYTTDLYSGSLPGIGGLVNGIWVLALRDCDAGTTGTLTYWSVRVQYSGGATIDLVADSLNLNSASVAPGGNVIASWGGHVAGSGVIGGPYTVSFYLSSDTNITTGDVLLGQVVESSALTPGSSFGESSPGRQLTIPSGTADGSYYVGMIIDSGNVVGETNEANNTAWSSLTVATGGGGSCLYGVSELYLQNGRFRVTGGAYINGVPTGFFLHNLCPNNEPSPTAAAFYFNTSWPPVQEGFVSVRDECSHSRHAFIVEVASASTRKFYIDVTDTWTSTTHRYQNPTGGTSVCFPADAVSFQGSCP
jgi:subtilisin-like proprotein convertase family protein